MKNDEIIEFCNEQHVKFIRLAFLDIFGKQKNLSILPSELSRAFMHGIAFDASAIDGFESVEHSDLFLFPDPNTLCILPWRSIDGIVVRMFCYIKYADGRPYEKDVRFLLQQAIKEANRHDLSINFGSEFEFYLLKLDESGNPTASPLDNAGYMDISPADKGENIRREICLTLAQMNIYPETSHHEEGPGQNEIDFKYSDPLSSADDATTFKWVVKSLADIHGIYASFDPKPLNNFPGNGLHINISIQDEKHFDHFLAGILDHIQEITLFLNPTDQSYLRLGKNKVSNLISWSYANRSSLVRIPLSAESKRLELRSPDSSCNIYLAYILLIYAGLDGIKNKAPLISSIDVNLFDQNDQTIKKLTKLPTNLTTAKEYAKKSIWLSTVINKDIINAYLWL